ncbi:unnamed protein product [Trichogramma brassicae]|uniref:Peptidase M13 N-terminal domain-containing protein n=1 Tax=Trichogramma brassicae TaxID=86971 RepID=A0A6H5IHS6_9HYME|nr:unnamed protein product [Trichogramma brassicae]
MRASDRDWRRFRARDDYDGGGGGGGGDIVNAPRAGETLLIHGLAPTTMVNARSSMRQEKQQHNQRSSSNFYYVSSDLYETTCANEHCNEVAEEFLKSVKKTVDPCSDFYAYSCARKSSKLRTSDISEMKAESDTRAKKKLKQFLNLSNGYSLFKHGKYGAVDWLTIDALYAQLGFEHAFFNAHVMKDPENLENNIMALTPPSPLFTISIHSLLKNRNFSEMIMNLLDKNHKGNLEDFNDVIAFNNELHGILPALAQFEESIKTLIENKMYIENWQRSYDSSAELQDDGKTNHIDWLRVLNKFTKSARVHMHKTDKIIVRNVAYFHKLAGLLEKTPASVLEKYIHIKFIAQVGKYLSPSLAKFFENFKNRSKFCIRQAENRLVGANYEFIKRHVPKDRKALKNKFLGSQLPNSINYGSFGSMIGAILYDFASLTDTLKYNLYLRTVEGLTKQTIDAYRVKEKCLSNQLTDYKKSDRGYNPLSDIIGQDTVQVDKIYEKQTGLRAAFEAFSESLASGDKTEQLLPGFEKVNPHQLFYLAYAEDMWHRRRLRQLRWLRDVVQDQRSRDESAAVQRRLPMFQRQSDESTREVRAVHVTCLDHLDRL